MHLGDLGAACDRLAEATGCPVVLEDPDYRVLAYSAIPGHEDDPVRDAAILKRRTPEAWLQWIARYGEPPEPGGDGLLIVEEPWPGLRRRAIKPVRLDDDLVGYLWFLEGPGGFPDPAGAALTQFEANVASTLASEGLAPGREEARLVRQAIEGTLKGDDLADQLGADRDEALTLTAYRLPHGGFTARVDQPEIMDTVRGPTEPGHRRCWVAVVGATVARVDLTPHPSPPVNSDLVHSARRLQRLAQGHVHASVSAPTNASRVSDAWQQALLGCDTLRWLYGENGRFATVDELRIATALHVVSRALDEHRPLFDTLLQPVAQSSRGADFVHTLATLLRHEGSISSAAEALHLHPNSVRYRYERLRADLTVDVDDPATRLALRLGTLDPRELLPMGEEL